MANLQDGVPLTELGVITRWSLAVRQSEEERAELISVLKADLAWLEGGRRRPEPGSSHGAGPDAAELTAEIEAASDEPAKTTAKRPAARPRKTAPARRTPA